MQTDPLQLNIGLFSSQGGNLAPGELCDSVLWQRLRRVYLWAEERFGPGVPRRLVCPADPEVEPTVIVACRFPEQLCKHQLVLDLWALCEELGQDCIAVHYAGYGVLVGPGAKAWGKFDENKFHFIDKA